MKMINNLNELLGIFGDEMSPEIFAKKLYKHVDCGPWIDFIHTLKPEAKKSTMIEVCERADGKLFAKDADWDNDEPALTALGFSRDYVEDWGLTKYRKMAEDFAKDLTGSRIDSLTVVPCIGCLRMTCQWTEREDVVHCAADEVELHMHTCTGVRIGSIVEGSDAEVGPISLRFPFTSEVFWDAVQHINDEATVLWEEANGDDDEDDDESLS